VTMTMPSGRIVPAFNWAAILLEKSMFSSLAIGRNLFSVKGNCNLSPR
jgi:hypothetical protein